LCVTTNIVTNPGQYLKPLKVGLLIPLQRQNTQLSYANALFPFFLEYCKECDMLPMPVSLTDLISGTHTVPKQSSGRCFGQGQKTAPAYLRVL
jgi:hypothetical protein